MEFFSVSLHFRLRSVNGVAFDKKYFFYTEGVFVRVELLLLSLSIQSA